ncbi:hypothetical protein CDAR_512981 [Caerostris darwini]|uniref:Uncharacterized protein n=1 Tax=Caerostris darwini TaxID=1538125 RepID=A0AAV4RYV3_9ARAC|nr:hypothetical protein CDAR_512981 [Caerostris darwini]
MIYRGQELLYVIDLSTIEPEVTKVHGTMFSSRQMPVVAGWLLTAIEVMGHVIGDLKKHWGLAISILLFNRLTQLDLKEDVYQRTSSTLYNPDL